MTIPNGQSTKHFFVYWYYLQQNIGNSLIWVLYWPMIIFLQLVLIFWTLLQIPNSWVTFPVFMLAGKLKVGAIKYNNTNLKTDSYPHQTCHRSNSSRGRVSSKEELSRMIIRNQLKIEQSTTSCLNRNHSLSHNSMIGETQIRKMGELHLWWTGIKHWNRLIKDN